MHHSNHHHIMESFLPLAWPTALNYEPPKKNLKINVGISLVQLYCASSNAPSKDVAAINKIFGWKKNGPRNACFYTPIFSYKKLLEHNKFSIE